MLLLTCIQADTAQTHLYQCSLAFYTSIPARYHHQNTANSLLRGWIYPVSHGATPEHNKMQHTLQLSTAAF